MFELPAAEFFDDVSTDASIAQNMERCRVCKILGSYSAATKQHDGIYATTDISSQPQSYLHLLARRQLNASKRKIELNEKFDEQHSIYGWRHCLR